MPEMSTVGCELFVKNLENEFFLTDGLSGTAYQNGGKKHETEGKETLKNLVRFVLPSIDIADKYFQNASMGMNAFPITSAGN
jgi:hypothetical protein